MSELLFGGLSASRIARELDREALADRDRRRQQIADQVEAERAAIWPLVTNDNAAAVLAWQRQRLAELEAQSCPHCGEALPRVNEYIPPTCGRSECQEAAYHANARRRFAGGRRGGKLAARHG